MMTAPDSRLQGGSEVFMILRGHLDRRGKTASHMSGHLAGVRLPAARPLRPPGRKHFSSQMMEMLFFSQGFAVSCNNRSVKDSVKSSGETIGIRHN